MSMPNVKTVQGDMCEFGMTIRDGDMDHPVRKRTKVMANTPSIVAHLGRHCRQDHTHMPFEGGNRTRQADVYLEELCRSIIIGLRQQMIVDGIMMDGCIGSICAVEPEWTPEGDQDMEVQYWDDITGNIDP